MTPIDFSQFSTRPRRCLQAAESEGIYFVEQIADMTDDQLLRLPNLGVMCLAEIRAVIPQKHSVQYMKDFLRDLKKKVEEMEKLLDNHSKYI